MCEVKWSGDSATPWTVASQAPHPWNFPGKSTGVGCHFLLQGNLPIQGLNPGLLHCRQTLYPLSHRAGECAYLFISYGCSWVFVAVRGLPLVAASRRAFSSCRASLAAERRLLCPASAAVARGLWSAEHGLSRPTARGAFLDRGSNSSPALAGRFLTTGPPGSC